VGAGLFNVTLDSANLSLADFSQSRWVSSSANSSVITAADFSGITFEDVEMIQAESNSLSPSGSDAPVFSGARIRDSVLDGTGLHRSDARQMEVDDTSWVDANFSGSRLDGAEFAGVALDRNTMSFLSATEARFVVSTLTGANMAASDFTGTRFDRVNLAGASLILTTLDQAEFIEVEVNQQTQCANGSFAHQSNPRGCGFDIAQTCGDGIVTAPEQCDGARGCIACGL
jgi:uncharacterized protein YjbI with pentapeptide repeats